ncbi:MAG: DUF502 domain-containing protein [Gammaproteobacteria bacterium]|nr:DUF502 domain-containing protein [Gammaproteobacteria bacterium]
MSTLSRIFLQGPAATLPVVIALYVICFLGAWAESQVGAVIQVLLPSSAYYPGMGRVLDVALIFLVGLASHLNTWLLRRHLGLGERLLRHIPLANTLYGAVRFVLTAGVSPEHVEGAG